MTAPRYGIRRVLKSATFADAVTAAVAALKKEGFGVLCEIDLAATLKEKIDVDMPRQLILAACNPQLAYQALQGEPDIGLLLPCNVVVRELEPNSIAVSAIDPRAVFGLVDNPGIEGIAADVEKRLRTALESIADGNG